MVPKSLTNLEKSRRNWEAMYLRILKMRESIAILIEKWASIGIIGRNSF